VGVTFPAPCRSWEVLETASYYHRLSLRTYIISKFGRSLGKLSGDAISCWGSFPLCIFFGFLVLSCHFLSEGMWWFLSGIEIEMCWLPGWRMKIIN
jgi:hypothetical protein